MSVLAALLGTAVCAGADFQAHEWGTFTSYQSADGEVMDWMGVPADPLPDFVCRNGPAPLVGKSDPRVFLRMETPVIYFHTKTARRIAVRVGFPQGVMTEWFPAATLEGRGILDWKEVDLTPWGNSGGTLPGVETENHYFAARKVEAAMVSVSTAGEPERERFLFYRGAGGGRMPVEVRIEGSDGRWVLTSRAGQTLPAAAAVEVREGRLRWQDLGGLAAGETRSFVPEWKGVGPVDVWLRGHLAGQGLHADEAAAMVETWRAHWLEEDGLRLLVLLPEGWTDSVLPLHIDPPPGKRVRVMVGRLEILPPETESVLAARLERGVRADQGTGSLRAATTGFSPRRFLVPALRLAARRLPADDVTAGQGLIFSLVETGGEKAAARPGPVDPR